MDFNNNILFISPHHDDVCFSLSGIIQAICKNQQIKLNMLNVFSVSNHIKSNLILDLNIDNKENIVEFASKIRKNEDENFCRKYNISYLNLDLEESAIYCNPFDNFEKDIYVNNKLKIFKKLNSIYNKETILFVPIAIGKHNDHLKVFNFVMYFFKNIKNSNIIFYQDSPYINYKEKIEERFDDIKKIFVNNGYESLNYYLDEDTLFNKINDVKNYKSQISDEEFKNFNIKKYCHSDNKGYYESIWISNDKIRNFLLKTFDKKNV